MTGARSAVPAASLVPAWIGLLAFAGSFGYFGYFYLVVLGTPVSRATHSPGTAILLDTLLFGGFALHHSLLARPRVKEWLVRWVPASYERTLYVWVSSVLFTLVCLGWERVAGPVLYQVTGLAGWAVRAAQAAAVVLAVRAGAVIDPLELAGIRQARGWQADTGVRIMGPYRWVRHPIYLAWIVFIFATPQMTPDRLTFACISTAYLLVAIPFEERSLMQVSDGRYAEARRRVRWRIVPYLY